jgi:hypothetical protein
MERNKDKINKGQQNMINASRHDNPIAHLNEDGWKEFMKNPAVQKRVQEIGDNVILDGINDGEISTNQAAHIKEFFDLADKAKKSGKPIPKILKKLGLF